MRPSLHFSFLPLCLRGIVRVVMAVEADMGVDTAVVATAAGDMQAATLAEEVLPVIPLATPSVIRSATFLGIIRESVARAQ